MTASLSSFHFLFILLFLFTMGNLLSKKKRLCISRLGSVHTYLASPSVSWPFQDAKEDHSPKARNRGVGQRMMSLTDPRVRVPFGRPTSLTRRCSPFTSNLSEHPQPFSDATTDQTPFFFSNYLRGTSTYSMKTTTMPSSICSTDAMRYVSVASKISVFIIRY